MKRSDKLLLLVVIIIGAVSAILYIFRERIPWLGRLFGDIVFWKGEFVFYIPAGSSLLISVVIGFVFWVIYKLLSK